MPKKQTRKQAIHNARHWERYENDPEYRAKEIAKVRKYAVNNREKVAALQRAYYARNKEKIRQRSAERYAKNAERNRAEKATYYRENKEKVKKLAFENIKKHAADIALRKRLNGKHQNFVKIAERWLRQAAENPDKDLTEWVHGFISIQDDEIYDVMNLYPSTEPDPCEVLMRKEDHEWGRIWEKFTRYAEERHKPLTIQPFTT